jgi:hypothetical protein
MDAVAAILGKRDFDIPAEVVAIKTYVRRLYQSEVEVLVEKRSLRISARSAGLIGTLRLNAPALQKAAQTDKKLYFVIA